MPECLFCAIGRDSEPSARVYEDDICKVFLDVYPASKGHLLIIPKQHYVTYDEMEIEVREHISSVTHRLCKAVMLSDLNPHGYNIQVNNGVAANQHVPHLHIHVIPRYRGDMLKVMGHFLIQVPGIFIGRKKLESLQTSAEAIRIGLQRVDMQ